MELRKTHGCANAHEPSDGTCVARGRMGRGKKEKKRKIGMTSALEKVRAVMQVAGGREIKVERE